MDRLKPDTVQMDNFQIGRNPTPPVLPIGAGDRWNDRIADFTQGDLRRFIVNLLQSDPGALPASIVRSLPSAAAIGDTLTYNGKDWVPTHPATGAVGDILVYNGTTWVATHMEPWRIVNTGIEPSFQNSWVNFDGGTSSRAAGFRKDIFGWVYLKGIVASGTMAQAIFALPSGYRPIAADANSWFPCISNSANSSAITVESDGSVKPQFGVNSWFSLYGVSFPTV